jgi:DNA-binding GntR family transcriptional regulator
MPLLTQWTREVLDRGQRVLALVASREAAEGGVHQMGGSDGHEAMLTAIQMNDPEAAEAAAGLDARGLGDGIAGVLAQSGLRSLLVPD